MRLRPFTAADTPAVERVLDASWPEDPILRRISAIHGERTAARRCFVAELDGAVVGVATVLGSERHPSRLFLAGAVAPECRRQGVGGALLDELQHRCADRPLLARVRDENDAGGRFLIRRGFEPVMRNRTVTVDPSVVAAWIAAHRDPPGVALDVPEPDELAIAHEVAYRREHVSWAPATERPLSESMAMFCGDSLDPSSPLVARRGHGVVAVASVHGAPFVDADNELALIAGTLEDDDSALRAAVARELELAGQRGKHLSIEADEANQALWRLTHELPHYGLAELVLVATG